MVSFTNRSSLPRYSIKCRWYCSNGCFRNNNNGTFRKGNFRIKTADLSQIKILKQIQFKLKQVAAGKQIKALAHLFRKIPRLSVCVFYVAI